MKKFLNILCVVFLAIGALILIAYVVGVRINLVSDDGTPAKLHCTYADNAMGYCIELSQSEKDQIIKMIDGAIAFPDNPSCPFSMSMSIEIAGTFYLPALDDCCIIKIGNTGRYIRIGENEKHFLMQVLSRKTGEGLREPY